MNKENQECLYSITSYYKYKGKISDTLTQFYSNYMIISSDKIPYSNILKVSRNKDGLRFLLIDSSEINIPVENTLKKQIFKMFKNLKDSTEIVDLEIVKGAVFLQFGDLSFLCYLKSLDYDEFRKTLLRRIGLHFYPNQSDEMLSLEHYEDFLFYIKKEETLIPIESGSDLTAALIYFDRKLNCFIKPKKKM